MPSNTKMAAVLPLALLSQLVQGQQIGTDIPEVHPKITTFECTTASGCTEKQTFLVADALSRPFHSSSDPNISCSDPTAITDLCPDAATCAQNCILEGVDYEAHGVRTDGSSMILNQYLFDGTEYKSVSPRVYLLAEDEMNYEMMKLVNKELTYDVDLSELVCGMNGALYLSEMEMSGMRTDDNPAGAAYGTGYCDAQCFNVPWINGMPNLNASGSCCNEMDIWEANARATAYTPHTCSGIGSFLCAGDECGASGVCDKSGCGLNPFRVGFPDYYGNTGNDTVDTSKPFTVVTQFVSSDGTDTGDLTEIKRLYVQDGNVIENHPFAPSDTDPAFVDDDFCGDGRAKDYIRLGGTKGMGESLKRGMVLIFSIWNSDGDFMNWLDSGEAGPCGENEGDPAQIVKDHPDVSVTFSNIRWGELGSTFSMNGDAPAGIPALKVAATQGAASKISGTWGPITMGFGVIVMLALM